MGHVRVLENRKCVSCGAVNYKMFRVGDFYMCLDCVHMHYPDFTYDTDDDEYRMFSEKYDSYIEEEGVEDGNNS